MTTNRPFDESPELDGPDGPDGPDYIALIIEWDQLADQLESELPDEPTERIAKRRRTGAIAAAIAGLVALVVLARWGIHRLRAA